MAILIGNVFGPADMFWFLLPGAIILVLTILLITTYLTRRPW